MADGKSPAFRLGIGSFAFRYAIGTDAFLPSAPMTVSGFMREAKSLGYDGVQLCENLGFSDLDSQVLKEVRDEADHLHLFLEIGMRGLTEQNLYTHLHIADAIQSTFLRIVIGEKSPRPSADPEQLARQAVDLLRSVMPHCEKTGLTIGLENHFDLSAGCLLEIVEQVDNPRLGLIFDTTNSLGFIEKPEETLERMGPRLLSAHIKDYRCEKEDTGYRTTGTRLGDGWLDTRGILRSILSWNPQATILLEMSIQRQENTSEKMVLASERDAILYSTDFIKEALSELTHTGKE